MSSMPREHQEESFSVPSALIQLGPALWLDLDGGMVIREEQHLLLTAREVNVLRILVRSMYYSRGYLSADAIAQQIHLTDVNNPEHCIEQTISTIRNKLGEIAHHPQILRGRRGLGYRLFVETAPMHNAPKNLNKS
jgi:DNA-binding response OmpR family regulator